jgi:hypothetical protein
MAFNIYDELAKEEKQDFNKGISYANLKPENVATAVMGQMGGMFGKSAANLAGFDTTAQSKQKALESIRDKFPNPETYQDFIDMSNEFRKIGMYDFAEDARKSAKEQLSTQKDLNKPVLAAEWRLDVGKKFTARFASDYLPGAPEGLEKRSDIVKYLNKLVAAGTIKNTIKNGWLKDYDKAMKEGKANYISTNASRTGTSTPNLVSSKDVFNANNQGTKLKQTGTSQSKYNQLLKEFNSLQEVADKASAANPSANVTINIELRKRQDALRKLMLELGPKIKEETNAPFSKDISSIFDTNAAKYNK